jgi:hypothetical protein
LELPRLVLLTLIGRGDYVVGPSLPVLVALIAPIIITVALIASPIAKSGFGLFFGCNHILNCGHKFSMSLCVILAEILKLTLIPDSHSKIVYDLMICNIINLCTQFSNAAIVIVETLILLLNIAFKLSLGRRVDEYSSKVRAESPLEIIPIPN